MRMEGKGTIQKNRRGALRVRVPGVKGGGASLGYPGDRKCLLHVASCLFPTSHFSVCLPPTGPHPFHSNITVLGGRHLGKIDAWSVGI